MKSKARQANPAAPRTRTYRGSRPKRPSLPLLANLGRERNVTKPESDVDVQESPAYERQAVCKQPARTKAANTKGKGKAAARDAPIPLGRGTPAARCLPSMPVSRGSAESPDIPWETGRRDTGQGSGWTKSKTCIWTRRLRRRGSVAGPCPLRACQTKQRVPKHHPR